MRRPGAGRGCSAWGGASCRRRGRSLWDGHEPGIGGEPGGPADAARASPPVATRNSAPSRCPMPGRLSMIAAWGQSRNRLVMSLPVSLISRSRSRSLRATLFDQRRGGRLAGQGHGLPGGCLQRGGGHGADALAPGSVRLQVGGQALLRGLAHFGGGGEPGDQDQRRPGGVVEGALQSGEDRAEQLAEPVHPAHPVGHQVRPVRGQPGQFDHQLIRGSDRSQVPAHPGDVGDYPGVLSVGLTLPCQSAPARPETIRPRNGTMFLAAARSAAPPAAAHHGLPGHEYPTAHRTWPPDRPPWDQLLDPPLLIGDLHRPQQPSRQAASLRGGAGFPGIQDQSRPHHEPSSGPSSSHQRWLSPWTTPRRSLNSDGSHQISISGQGVPGNGAAFLPEATTRATSHQPHPVALGIQGTNPRQLRP